MKSFSVIASSQESGSLIWESESPVMNYPRASSNKQGIIREIDQWVAFPQSVAYSMENSGSYCIKLQA